MSYKTVSSEEIANTIPLNRKIKPKAHSIARDHLIFPPCNVSNQMNTFTPIGIAMIIIADVKHACVFTSLAMVNIW